MRLIGTVLGNVLVFGGTVFYPYYRPGDALWHISPMADQVAAGGLMMVEESLLTIGLFCWLFLRVAGENEQRQQLLDFAREHGLEPRREPRPAGRRRRPRRRADGAPAQRDRRLVDRAAAPTASGYLTVIVPTMPAARWPGTVQKNVYLPGLRLAETVEVPPLATILPTWLTPLPLIAMSCGVEDLLSMLIVT